MTPIAMSLWMIIAICAAALSFGAVVAWLIMHSASAELRAKAANAQELATRNAALEQDRDLLQTQLFQLHQEKSQAADYNNEQIRSLMDEKTALQVTAERLQQEFVAETAKTAWLADAEIKLRTTLGDLTASALKSNSEYMATQNAERMSGVATQWNQDWTNQRLTLEQMVVPLRESVESLTRNSHELEVKRQGAYSELGGQLTALSGAYAAMQQTTTSLATALKSTGHAGQWGELQLRRAVEVAGMKEHIDFDEQVTLGDFRPDMIVRLPNSGCIIVDAKASMIAYINASQEKDDDKRKAYLGQHVRDLKSQVKLLGDKKYWQRLENSPDFVIMFVPNEACLSVSCELDPSLLEDAMSKRVLIASPMSLLGILKTIAYG